MTPAAKSIFVFGLYLIGLGGILLLLPQLAFLVFGLTGTSEVWIRVNGMLVLFLAFYCIQAARYELTLFIQWTVYPRALTILFFSAFVLFGLARPVLILFGVVDLLAAIWTGLALRSAKAN